MELTDTAAVVIGVGLVAPKLVELAMSFFKGSVKRNVDTEDRAKEKLEADVEDLKREQNSFKLEMQRLTMAHDNHKSNITTELGIISGRLTALDTRISESANHLAVELNRKLSATLGSEIPEIVRQTMKDLRRRTR